MDSGLALPCDSPDLVLVGFALASEDAVGRSHRRAAVFEAAVHFGLLMTMVLTYAWDVAYVLSHV